MDIKLKSNYESLFHDEQKFDLEGNLTSFPLPRIFYFLKSSQKTGVLSIAHKGAKKIISFEMGDPKFVISNIIEECLGQIFISKGRITQEQCNESLQLMKKSKKKQGEILIKMGILEPYEIDEALKAQARERIIGLFSWQEGNYKFSPKMSLRKDLIPIDIEIPQIVLLGVRRYYALDYLRPFLDKWLDYVPSLDESPLFKMEEFKFATWEAKIFRNFDGTNTLREIINKKIARELDVYHIVFILASLNVLKFKDPLADKKVQEEITRGKNLERIRLEQKKAKRREEVIELTKDFVVGSEENENKKIDGKTKFLFSILVSVLLIIGTSLFYIKVFKGRINVSKYFKSGIIKSALVSEGTLNLICEDTWNRRRDKKVTRNILKRAFPRISKDGYKKVILRDSKGRTLGYVISKKNKALYLEIK